MYATPSLAIMHSFVLDIILGLPFLFVTGSVVMTCYALGYFLLRLAVNVTWVRDQFKRLMRYWATVSLWSAMSLMFLVAAACWRFLPDGTTTTPRHEATTCLPPPVNITEHHLVAIPAGECIQRQAEDWSFDFERDTLSKLVRQADGTHDHRVYRPISVFARDLDGFLSASLSSQQQFNAIRDVAVPWLVREERGLLQGHSAAIWIEASARDHLRRRIETAATANWRCEELYTAVWSTGGSAEAVSRALNEVRDDIDRQLTQWTLMSWKTPPVAATPFANLVIALDTIEILLSALTRSRDSDRCTIAASETAGRDLGQYLDIELDLQHFARRNAALDDLERRRVQWRIFMTGPE